MGTSDWEMLFKKGKKKKKKKKGLYIFFSSGIRVDFTFSICFFMASLIFDCVATFRSVVEVVDVVFLSQDGGRVT